MNKSVVSVAGSNQWMAEAVINITAHNPDRINVNSLPYGINGETDGLAREEMEIVSDWPETLIGRPAHDQNKLIFILQDELWVQKMLTDHLFILVTEQGRSRT